MKIPSLANSNLLCFNFMSSMLGDKIIVKLLENLLYLTAIGTESKLKLSWRNVYLMNGKTTLVRRENVDWSSLLYSVTLAEKVS